MAIAEHNRKTLVSEDKQVKERDVRSDVMCELLRPFGVGIPT